MDITVNATKYSCECKWRGWSAAHHKTRLRRFRILSSSIKGSTPCADCNNYFDPVAMDFDHLPGSVKVFNISGLHPCVTLGKFYEEIRKCEVVCANCHRIRTFNRLDKARFHERFRRAGRIAREKKTRIAERIWGDRSSTIRVGLERKTQERERKERVYRFLCEESLKRKLGKEELDQMWSLHNDLFPAAP